MNKKQKQILYAIVLAIIVAFAHHAYVENQISQYRDVPMIRVLRAARSLSAGSVLTSDMIEEVRVPEKYAPKDRFLANQKDQAIGLKLTSDVAKGDYVVQGYFSAMLPVGKTLSEQLAGQDYRAITLPVDETNSFSQSLRSGDKVDIIYTYNIPPLRQSFSSVLLQNVPVISTGMYSASEQERGAESVRTKAYSTITLRLPMQDALRLNYARHEGKISILLRSSSDNNVQAMAPISSVLDIISPADKELVQQAAQERLKNVRVEGDRLREQVKTVMDQARQQKGPSSESRGEE